jgi:hypothetical protein
MTMKPYTLPTYASWFVATLCLIGCSTTRSKLGSGDSQLVVGKKYVLRRDAILLERRGSIASIENPDYKLENYQPYKNYDPYSIRPRGVLPAGTILQVKRIRKFKNDSFDVEGEILSGEYKRQPVSAYAAAKGVTIGDWPPTGMVMMENLCGGRSFDPTRLPRNLSEKTE